jgi:hypothetical protein
VDIPFPPEPGEFGRAVLTAADGGPQDGCADQHTRIHSPAERDLAKRAAVNKSQAIRDALAANRGKSPSEIAELLKEQGLEVTGSTSGRSRAMH